MTISSFNFTAGRILARKYEVLYQLGNGWEGEVYLVREIVTGIERAAKFFYPERNKNNKTLTYYAKKLHKLRHCPILIQYLGQDNIQFKGHTISFLISDFIEGELLHEFLERQPGKRLHPFQSLHLLYTLSKGIEDIHSMGEFHGDLHTNNIIISQYGIGFEIKLIDFFDLSPYKRENIHDDVISLIKIFYDSLGGAKNYAKQSKEIKSIICGLKHSLILNQFNTAGKLCDFLENIEWQ